MDLDARIKRRQGHDEGQRLIQSYESLSPAAHIEEPSDRGPIFERLLDHLDPVFDGTLPPNAYVHGAFGSGKSAIVTALFTHLNRLSTQTGSVIHTSTRAASPTIPEFVYLDMRETVSEFAFYHRILDACIEETVPQHGISTDELRQRLHEALNQWYAGVVLAIDHVDEPESIGTATLVDRLSGLPSNVSWLAISRTPPAETDLTTYTATSIEIDSYQRQMLVDVLMTRASAGLTQQALDHELAREIAEWAEGNAHDALAALFIAADRANRDRRTRLLDTDVTAAIDEIPRPSVSMARVQALPENKQLVLRELVDLSAEDRASVAATTDAISGSPGLDLSRGTVKRFLYEMAEIGIVDRVQAEGHSGKGRPPSRVELRFPATLFRRLYDLRQESTVVPAEL
ncbi:Cdc6/Cdc18 family protein [Halobellus clavatus]|uniref:Cdc6-related protein, AAA superfamily ATPase n=1 Tax=Halobellus clavatus TaxID=660517 RepID=A0A1H3GQK3_9EURY|nr:AAA family ATPase [Halobellus clavatus]SDY04754.1 Cdc6-related protein, AAA superfamily ATPase [Halobellus clavatus]